MPAQQASFHFYQCLQHINPKTDIEKSHLYEGLRALADAIQNIETKIVQLELDVRGLR